MPLTAFAPSVGFIWTFLETHGHDPRHVLSSVGIDPAFLHRSDARLPIESADALWCRTVDLVGDPCFGIKAAAHWHPSYLGALGYAWLTSRTLRGGIERIERYMSFVSGAVSLSLRSEQKGARAVFRFKTQSARQAERAALFIAVLTEMCRVNYVEPFDPVEVCFSQPMPSCAGDFYAFFRCPVSFSAGCDGVLFDHARLDEHLPGDNPQLAHVNDELMAQELRRLGEDDLIARIKAVLLAHLPSGDVSIAMVAKALHMSPSTLQRRIRALGSTYKRILDGLRRELAERYMAEGKRSVGEVSYLLGFSETAAFTRAFKRWTGATPREYQPR